MEDSGMRPADFSAMLNNDGLGGNNWFAMIILFALIFGWGGGGFGGYGNNGAAAMQQGFDQQNTLANQRELLAATNQTFHDTLGVVQNAYGELQRDIAGLAVGQANLLAKQNECCAEVNAGIAQNRFDAALGNANIMQAIQAEGNATRAMLQENKIEALQAQVQQLQMQNAMQGVVRYPDAFTFNAGANPFCGCGNGCGYNM